MYTWISDTYQRPLVGTIDDSIEMENDIVDSKGLFNQFLIIIIWE